MAQLTKAPEPQLVRGGHSAARGDRPAALGGRRHRAPDDPPHRVRDLAAGQPVSGPSGISARSPRRAATLSGPSSVSSATGADFGRATSSASGRWARSRPSSRSRSSWSSAPTASPRRVLWDEVIGQPALLNDVPPSTVIGLTSTVLEYFDEISAAVGGAYLETRERLLRQRDRDRDRILQRLLAGDASTELRRIAASAELTLLPPYTVVACSVPTQEAERLLEETWRAEGAHLIGDDPGLWIALVPDGRDLAKLCAAVGSVVFGVGPVAMTLDAVAPVGAAGAPRARGRPPALPRPCGAHRRRGRGLRRARRRSRGHAHLHRPRARPAGVGHANRRLELVATLEALLDSRSIGEAAERLGVHRHTVVYRIGRLRQLGIDSDDPEQRHQLWLALRCARLLED